MSTLHERLLDRLAELDADIPMDGSMGPALRAVVELHAPQDTYPASTTHIGYTACCGCDCDGYDWEYPRWPCSTIRTIAEHLGVTEGTDRG